MENCIKNCKCASTLGKKPQNTKPTKQTKPKDNVAAIPPELYLVQIKCTARAWQNRISTC